ncbi:DUF3021 domain-containing protein [Staphylococcus simiae]|uniref:DUF3021 domain-containing protein n=1 Tax=Staphylococcus simiae TaxID=308354 RepID=UPI001A959BE3|nr:DUF3021 domain-containing protein [Staphylococcus simiae]MBO1198677.1 DUF3021 domain-containing protein [Staphylococcus simiae]MBO1200838.1 DUF3021 domain-containing protein [Staphylococcus simiae]MBO1203046.1 DUF3021 domain-containing protein [Staphylococcus simiae]MBO1211303.1 DUF3021 domain-containing protein [Staphylococcus simiae]MBO1229174.1 DUF3021 domain-containing protein [Staphylococcus simiae]
MTKIIRSIFISLLIGLTLSILFSALYAQGHYYPLNPVSTIGQFYFTHFSEPAIMTIAIILWLLIGFVFYIGSLIFNATDWSITTATILHFIVTYFGFLPLAILAGWFPITIINLLFFTVIFIAIYIVIWLINYFKNKNYVRAINQELQQKRR